MRAPVLTAALAALAVRLFFLLRFPFDQATDTKLYEELARNWLDHGTYGIWLTGRLVPVDIRMPGYPAFLAGMHSIFGRGLRPVLAAQAFVDLAACFVIAAIARRLAPAESRGRVGVAALWLAGLCPFVANYCAAPLTEVVATFFTALALLVLLTPPADIGPSRMSVVWEASFQGGLLVGLGTLVRPETPLVLVAAALVLLVRWWRLHDWSKLVRAAVLMAIGLALPLAPWAVRNWRTLGEVQFLAPRYANLPGEFVPRGFYAWTKTWLWRFGDVYLVPWKLEEEPIRIEDLPASAFDSAAERERVAALLDQHNAGLDLTPELDRQFAELAAGRARGHPLRTYFVIPAKRAAAMWFTPRVELLPFSGHLWPLREKWDEDPVDFSVTAAFGLLNSFFVALAVAGAWRARHQPGVALLVAFVVVRTAFVTQVETPEPRYVLECFPALLALGAQVWSQLPRA